MDIYKEILSKLQRTLLHTFKIYKLYMRSIKEANIYIHDLLVMDTISAVPYNLLSKYLICNNINVKLVGSLALQFEGSSLLRILCSLNRGGINCGVR